MLTDAEQTNANRAFFYNLIMALAGMFQFGYGFGAHDVPHIFFGMIIGFVSAGFLVARMFL